MGPILTYIKSLNLVLSEEDIKQGKSIVDLATPNLAEGIDTYTFKAVYYIKHKLEPLIKELLIEIPKKIDNITSLLISEAQIEAHCKLDLQKKANEETQAAIATEKTIPESAMKKCVNSNTMKVVKKEINKALKNPKRKNNNNGNNGNNNKNKKPKFNNSNNNNNNENKSTNNNNTNNNNANNNNTNNNNKGNNNGNKGNNNNGNNNNSGNNNNGNNNHAPKYKGGRKAPPAQGTKTNQRRGKGNQEGSLSGRKRKSPNKKQRKVRFQQPSGEQQN